MTPIGIARARDLINAKQLSPDTVRRMLAYFTRHEVDKQGSTWAVYGKGRQAWDGWGGDAGYTWAKKVVGQMDKADQEYKALSELRPVASLIKGKPFLTLALGDVNSRMNGNKISTITLKDLEEIVRVFYERKTADNVIIDWNHASSPYASSLSSPDVSMALGQIADLEIKDNGLYAYPLYTAKGAQIVEESEGNLWSSPEFIIGPVYARDGGNKIGDAQLLAVTLTPRPAQSQSKIDRILLTEKLMDQTELQGKSPDELIAMLLEKDALVKQLEAKLSALESEMESSVSEDAVLVADGEKKDGYAAMSEASVKLMNEMSSKITALNEQVGKLQAEKHGAERKNAIDALLNTGKIAPSEKAVAEEAYDLKDRSPSFWKMFSERQANQAVNLSEVGHAEASKPISLSEQVRSIQKEKGITFAQALDLFKNENPQAYKQYFGV
jgi:phage I-like protein